MMRRFTAAAIAAACLAAGGAAAHASDRSRGPHAATYSDLVTFAAVSAGVPSGLAHAVVQHESGYNPTRRGAAGEWGIGQIKCQTARGVGFRGPCRSLADAATNLRYSMAYLRLALAKGGNGCRGVTLYNTGIAARPHCNAYGRAVMRRVKPL